MLERRFKHLVCVVCVLAIMGAYGSQAQAGDSAGSANKSVSIDLRIASVLLPGAGQAQNGHYTKAALFASAAVLSGAGVFFAQIQYNRALDRYESEKRIYLSYDEQMKAGREVAYTDILATYTDMEAAFDQADERAKWRNVFLGALVATYTLNLIDILVSGTDTGERLESPPVSLELYDGDIRLVRIFDF